MLPDRIRAAYGLAPSLPPVKLYKFVKPPPSVLTANTVPLPALPPATAVPYSVLPDKIRPANGVAPSLLVEGVGPEVAVKLCRVVKVCAVTRPAGIKPRQAISAGRRNRQWILVFIEFPGFVYLICMMRFSYDFTPR